MDMKISGWNADDPGTSLDTIVETLRSAPKATGFGKQAKTLDNDQIRRVVGYIHSYSSTPAADELKFLLSVRAGLRAGEIATLELRSLLDAEGSISRTIEIFGRWTKNRQSRDIPMHPEVRQAVRRFRQAYPNAKRVALSLHNGRIHHQSAKTLSTWFRRLYRRVGFHGCSSHSGRRTFITELARRANDYGKSLRDVQLLAGHASLATTERYIDRADDNADLVRSL